MVDVALYEAVFAMMEMVPSLTSWGSFERTGNVMPESTPSNTHTTKDGRHLIIGANTGDAIFKRLMRAIGRARSCSGSGPRGTPAGDARCGNLRSHRPVGIKRHRQSMSYPCLRGRVPSSQHLFGGRHVPRDPQ